MPLILQDYSIRYDKEENVLKSLCYVSNPAKTPNNYIGSLGCSLDTEQAAIDFADTRNIYSKTPKQFLRHFTISFHPEEMVTPEQAYYFAWNYASFFYPEYQCYFSVHETQGSIHIHFIYNTVSRTTGRIFRYTHDTDEVSIYSAYLVSCCINSQCLFSDDQFQMIIKHTKNLQAKINYINEKNAQRLQDFY